MIYAFGAVATFVMVFGMTGRGSWSPRIAIIGGLLWVTAVFAAFYSLSWLRGIFFLVGTFILGSILQYFLRPVLNPRGH